MSRIRSLNALLLIGAVIGGVLTYRAARTHRELLAEKNRLEQKVGSLSIKDPSKIQVEALETGEPLHFAWRIYRPADIGCSWQAGTNGRRSWAYGRPREFISRVRFRESYDGQLGLFVNVIRRYRGITLANRQLTDLLRDRWDEIQVEQLGCDHLVIVEPDEVAVLLRLTFSEQLKREAEQILSKDDWEHFRTALFECRLGSEKAFEQAETDQPSADQ